MFRFLIVLTISMSGGFLFADQNFASCQQDLGLSEHWLDLKGKLDAQEIHVSSEDRLRLTRRWLQANIDLPTSEKDAIFEKFRAYLKAQHYIWSCKRFISDDGKYILFVGSAGHSLIFAQDGRMFGGMLGSLPEVERFYSGLVENGPVHVPPLPAPGIVELQKVPGT